MFFMDNDDGMYALPHNVAQPLSEIETFTRTCYILMEASLRFAYLHLKDTFDIWKNAPICFKDKADRFLY